jgi:hypothetical protein
VDALVERLSPAFYVSRQAVCQALNERSSFNAIHIAAAFKIDVFSAMKPHFKKTFCCAADRFSIPGCPALSGR